MESVAGVIMDCFTESLVECGMERLVTDKRLGEIKMEGTKMEGTKMEGKVMEGTKMEGKVMEGNIMEGNMENNVGKIEWLSLSDILTGNGKRGLLGLSDILPNGGKRGMCLQEGFNAINGEKVDCHGKPEDNFKKIAALWSSYKGCEFTEKDVALMMTLFKIGRIVTGTAKEDSYKDAAGYLGLASEFDK